MTLTGDNGCFFYLGVIGKRKTGNCSQGNISSGELSDGIFKLLLTLKNLKRKLKHPKQLFIFLTRA